MGNKFLIKASLYINYFVFAILLNSVGIVILKVQNNFGISPTSASNLEAFKDLPIAFVSFAIASFLPRIGYKKGMMYALLMVVIACLVMIFGNSFLSSKILFALVGASFAIIKVSVYSVIGLVTDTDKEHNSLMSSIEGFFMIGIASAYFIFPFFNETTDSDAWLNTYWFLGVLTLISFLFLLRIDFSSITTKKTESSLSKDFSDMLGLITKIVTLVFVIAAFMFVMVEQGIMTWLPTFNTEVLQLNEDLSIMMASILALSLAVGRILSGYLVKKINWFYIVSGCVLVAMLMVVTILPKLLVLEVGEISTITDIPIMGFAFPFIGLFIAPIYPLLNSTVLVSLPERLHSAMTGLIVVFSALGGTFGSKIIGWLFETQGAQNAFYYTLIPMFGLLISFFILQKLTSNAVSGK